VPRLAPGLDHVIADDRGPFRVALQEEVFHHVPPHFLRRFRPRLQTNVYTTARHVGAESETAIAEAALKLLGVKPSAPYLSPHPPRSDERLNTVFIVYYYQRLTSRCNLTLLRT
jgi:hypothetical protein